MYEKADYGTGGVRHDFLRQSSSCKVDLITENSTNHIQIEKDDRHLFLEIKIECGELVKSEQAISICTSVKFHNALGRIYFFFIKPFHKLLCRMALNRIKMSEANVGGR